MIENYKDIPWYEWLYQVSNLWRVKSFKYWKEKLLKNILNIHWYYVRVNLYKDNKSKPYNVHRLVATVFNDDNSVKLLKHQRVKWSDHGHSKKVNQYDLQWNFIKEWWSAIDVAKELNISKSSISLCCTWKCKTAWGFKWKFKKLTTI